LKAIIRSAAVVALAAIFWRCSSSTSRKLWLEIVKRCDEVSAACAQRYETGGGSKVSA